MKRLRITNARISAGLSQDDLAKKCGVSRWTINRIELGERDPSFLLMKKIVDALGNITLDDFNAEDETPEAVSHEPVASPFPQPAQ